MNQNSAGRNAYVAPQITDLGGHAAFVQGSYPGGKKQDNQINCPPGVPYLCYLTFSPN